MDQERATAMRRFLNEYRIATGRDGHNLLIESELPEFPVETRDVRFPIEVVKRFRNDYRLALEFVALMCKCEVEEVTPFHMLAPFLRMVTPPEED